GEEGRGAAGLRGRRPAGVRAQRALRLLRAARRRSAARRRAEEEAQEGRAEIRGVERQARLAVQGDEAREPDARRRAPALVGAASPGTGPKGWTQHHAKEGPLRSAPREEPRPGRREAGVPPAGLGGAAVEGDAGPSRRRVRRRAPEPRLPRSRVGAERAD